MKDVVILTDRLSTVHAVREALAQVTGLRIVGVCPRSHPVSPMLRRLRPDVVLVDGMGTVEHALVRIGEVCLEAPRAKCLFLSPGMTESMVRPALVAGAHAAVANWIDPASLGRLVCDVTQERVIQRSPWEPAAHAAPADCPLTRRELQVLRLVAEGHPNSRIATQLCVTEQTVKFHLSRTYRKLGVVNRTEATRYAHVHRLVGDPADRLAV